MTERLASFAEEAMSIWASGGWLMAPLAALAIYIFYVALELYLRLGTHFLARSKAYNMSDRQIAEAFSDRETSVGPLLLLDARSPEEARRHFGEIRNEYLPVADRRIRFLAIIVTTGPLIGLLGTVTGMLTTFGGMVAEGASKFDSMIRGISEALITTQCGLIISIPGFALLALIAQRRKALERSLSCLERYNARLAIKNQTRPASVSSRRSLASAAISS